MLRYLCYKNEYFDILNDWYNLLRYIWIDVEFIKILGSIEFPHEKRGDIIVHTVTAAVELRVLGGDLRKDNNAKEIGIFKTPQEKTNGSGSRKPWLPRYPSSASCYIFQRWSFEAFPNSTSDLGCSVNESTSHGTPHQDGTRYPKAPSGYHQRTASEFRVAVPCQSWSCCARAQRVSRCCKGCMQGL